MIVLASLRVWGLTTHNPEFGSFINFLDRTIPVSLPPFKETEHPNIVSINFPKAADKATLVSLTYPLQNVSQIRETKTVRLINIYLLHFEHLLFRCWFEWKQTTEISFHFSPCGDSGLSHVCSPLSGYLQIIIRKWRGMSGERVYVPVLISSHLPFSGRMCWGGWEEG